MNILCLPSEIQDHIIDYLPMDAFYRFCVTSKHFTHLLEDNNKWIKYMNNIIQNNDPYCQYFKRNYKNQTIKLLFKNVKLTLGVYYHRYLIDKYTISVNDANDYSWMNRKLCMIERNENKSDLDVMEMNILKQRIVYNKKRINKYNELQYKFSHVSKQYRDHVSHQYKEFTNKNTLRITLLVDYLLNSDLFEYNSTYTTSIDDLKKGFKKYSKRFIKIEPRIYESEITHSTRAKLDKLTQMNIYNKYNTPYGTQSIYYVIRGPTNNLHLHKYSFYKNDIICGLRFKT